MKHPKHDILTKDYDSQKAEHLTLLANKMLKNDTKLQKLKEKHIDPKFLKLF